jgi:hypothetical protein
MKGHPGAVFLLSGPPGVPWLRSIVALRQSGLT